MANSPVNIVLSIMKYKLFSWKKSSENIKAKLGPTTHRLRVVINNHCHLLLIIKQKNKKNP